MSLFKFPLMKFFCLVWVKSRDFETILCLEVYIYSIFLYIDNFLRLVMEKSLYEAILLISSIFNFLAVFVFLNKKCIWSSSFEFSVGTFGYSYKTGIFLLELLNILEASHYRLFTFNSFYFFIISFLYSISWSRVV